MTEGHGEKRVVARRASLVAVGTLGSRVLGMARESVCAAVFDVAATDAFFIAFTIPNTLRMLLGEGAVSNAFVPVFAEARAAEGKAVALRFFAGFLGSLGLLLAVATLLGMLSAPAFTVAYAGGFLRAPERYALVTDLTRWLFPFLFLSGLSALATGALNALGSYAVSAFAPLLLNVAMIAAPFALAGVAHALGLAPVGALALGALLGGFMQIAPQLWALHKLNALPRPRLGLDDPHVKKALRLMLPLVLGLGVYQLNMLLSRLFASFLPEGSQSYLNYGQRVVEIPQGMFALAVASAALPTLARLRSEGKRDELLSLFSYSLRLTLLVSLPASVALAVLAEPVAAVLFGRGVFGPEHVRETSHSLAFQALSVWAVAAVRTVVPMFAAHQDTRTPVRASAVNLLVFLSVTALLMPRFNHVALAVGNSVAACVQLGLLVFWLRKKLGPMGLGALTRSAVRMTAAALCMGATLWLARGLFEFGPGQAEWARVLALGALVALGGLVFVGSATVFGVEELGALAAALRRRAKKAT
jgi:putative peptidoglycan lipid II flippase